MEKECGRFLIECPHCGAEMERDKLSNHIYGDCPEAIVDCDYKRFGCGERMKRKERNSHLEDTAVKLKHTEMKLKHTEREVIDLKRKLQPFTYRNELLIVTSSDPNHAVFKCNIQSKQKQSLPAAPDIYNFHAFGKNVPFNIGVKMGLSRKDLAVGPNNIVFGQNVDQIGVCYVDSGKWSTYGGELKWRDGPLVTSRHHGSLLKVGCKSDRDSDPQDAGHIISMQFNEDGTFIDEKIGNMSYNGTYPGALIFNAMEERMFVCGGWWNQRYLKDAEIHHLETGNVMKLKKMLHEHACPGVARNGDKIVVAAGFDNSIPNGNQIVEEYDMVKQKWIELPSLSTKQSSYPALWESNGIMICCATTINTDFRRLGAIEMFDPRDHQCKWIEVDTVQNYFGLDSECIRGYNNIIPL